MALELPSGIEQSLAFSHSLKIQFTNIRDTILSLRTLLFYPWNSISKIHLDFSKHSRYDPGRGDMIRLWEDLWLGEILLFQKFQ